MIWLLLALSLCEELFCALVQCFQLMWFRLTTASPSDSVVLV